MDTTNRISDSQTIRGEQAYAYALKDRAKRHHCLGYGTFSAELDTLEALRRQYSRAVRPITHLPLYIKAVARAIELNPEANAVLFKKPFGLKIVRFERVDVSLPITRRIGDRWVTFVGTVRNAAARSLAEIQEELVEYLRCPPERSFAIRRMQQFARMPLWMAQLVHRRMTWSPEFYIRNVGTCGLTLVGADWGEYLFPIAPTSVVLGIGAARREPVVQDDQIVIRRRLHCCMMADNFVISGLTGARLAHDFKELLETGSFVTDEL